jgi:SAM-dependent methyltransferase
MEFQQVLTDYARLEPDQDDTWNPLRSDGELAHRLALFAHLTVALRHVDQVESLRVLDVGCGNGRSTRMYLDLGLYPEQLTGVDLREGAVRRATRTHSGISFHVASDADLPSRGWTWVSATTVFSSIREKAARERLAREIRGAVCSGGYVFYFDLIRANQWAGGDPIRPNELFANMDVVWAHRFPIAHYRLAPRIPQRRTVPTAATFRERLYRFRRRVRHRLGPHEPTHESILFLSGLSKGIDHTGERLANERTSLASRSYAAITNTGCEA